MADDLAPFVTLVKMIEQELELVATGDLVAVRAAVSQRGRLIAQLPPVPPPDAATLLLRAQALHSRMIVEMRRVEADFERRRACRARARVLGRAYVAPLRRYSASA